MVTIDDEETYEESFESAEEVEIEEDLEKFVSHLMQTYQFEQQAMDSVKCLGNSLSDFLTTILFERGLCI